MQLLYKHVESPKNAPPTVMMIGSYDGKVSDIHSAFGSIMDIQES